MVYRSVHLSYVRIPQSDLYLLLHPVRGAVDIVPQEFLQELERFGSSAANGLSETEVDTLKRRGYLTDSPAEQELEQASTILRVLSRNLQPLVELTFDLSTGSSDSSDLIDRAFSLARDIAGEQGTIKVSLEIPAAVIDEQLMARILDQARRHRSTVVPRLTIAGFTALTPWLKSENFRQVLLISDRETMSLDVESVANNIINFFKQQVHLLWKCDVNGMAPEQLAAVVEIIRRVRDKYPIFTTRLISEQTSQTASENWITVGDTFLPFISPENETVLNTLLNLVLAPKKINYFPFFAPDPHKLTCDLDSKRLTYKSPFGNEVSGELDEIRAHFESTHTTETTPPIEDRATCKYALICGCRHGMNGCSNGQPECAAVYEERVRQVLPLLVFNLQKWKSRAAGSAE